MKYFILPLLIILTGCSPSSQDYRDVMIKCSDRKGQYFTIMIPTTLGPRLAAGCLEK